MAHIVFAQSLNLSSAKVRNLDDLVRLLMPMFKMGRKYYFFCDKGAFYEPVTGRQYTYAIRCHSFPINGGTVSDEYVAYSNRPIRLTR